VQPYISSGGRGNFLDFEEYHVTISGFGGQRGSYEFELICSDASCPTGGSCKESRAQTGCWPELNTDQEDLDDWQLESPVLGPCKAFLDHTRFRTCKEYCGHLGLACISMDSEVIIGRSQNSRGIFETEHELRRNLSCDHITTKNEAASLLKKNWEGFQEIHRIKEEGIREEAINQEEVVILRVAT